MSKVKLVTGSIKHSGKRKINWKAEREIRRCQRAIERQNKQDEDKLNWKRIPKE